MTQPICDRLGPTQITEFAQRWFSVLPVPLTDAGAAAGYWWELSMLKVCDTRVQALPAKGEHADACDGSVVTV